MSNNGYTFYNIADTLRVHASDSWDLAVTAVRNEVLERDADPRALASMILDADRFDTTMLIERFTSAIMRDCGWRFVEATTFATTIFKCVSQGRGYGLMGLFAEFTAAASGEVE